MGWGGGRALFFPGWGGGFGRKSRKQIPFPAGRGTTENENGTVDSSWILSLIYNNLRLYFQVRKRNVEMGNEVEARTETQRMKRGDEGPLFFPRGGGKAERLRPSKDGFCGLMLSI